MDPNVFRQRGKNMTLKKEMIYTTVANGYKEGKMVHLFSINDEVIYMAYPRCDYSWRRPIP